MFKKIILLLILSLIFSSCRKSDLRQQTYTNFAQSTAYRLPTWDFTARAYPTDTGAVLVIEIAFLGEVLPPYLTIKINDRPPVQRQINAFYTCLYEEISDQNSDYQLAVQVEEEVIQHPVFLLPAIVPPLPSLHLQGKNWQGLSEKHLASFLAKVFVPALPPMEPRAATDQDSVLVANRRLAVTPQSTVNETEGFYFLQRNDDSPGMGTRVVAPDFLKPQKIETLVEPLLYISTQAEMQRILIAPDKRAAFDAFWLKQAQGNLERAKKMVRTFYRRVAYANAFFADYKEGWKTDRGMIYIVFGEPEERVPSEAGEEWFYVRQEQGIKYRQRFFFTRVPNTLTAYHYALVRSRSLKSNWYRAVAAWRSPEGW
ncbi:MAG: GWxTD domain-containing protein [Bernardetiaceae bacterium]